MPRREGATACASPTSARRKAAGRTPRCGPPESTACVARSLIPPLIVNVFFALCDLMRREGARRATMSGAGFILAINLFVAGLLAAAFMTIAAYDRRRESARWLALGYVDRHVELPDRVRHRHVRNVDVALVRRRLRIVSGGAWPCSTSASPANMRVPVPWMTMAVVFVVSVVTCYLIQDMPRQSFMRMLLYQIALFHHAGDRGRHRRPGKVRSTLDNVLMALLAASALQFLSASHSCSRRSAAPAPARRTI